MGHATIYPPADRSSQWYGNGGATVSPDTVLLHTTETAGGWPGYSGGDTAPGLTYEPWQHKWRQHFPLNGTARALKNGPNGYKTNRKGAVQIEISAYCDPARMGPKHISKFDQQAYDDLGAFLAFMNAEWGIPIETTVGWKPYPASYGNNGVRLSESAFANYRGVCGHMHAVHNSHGDPGDLDIARILAAAGGGGPTPTVEEDMGYPIFMGTTPAEGGKIYRLAPGEPKTWLDPQMWGLYTRLFPYWASLPGSPFLEVEVDMVNNDIQGNAPGAASAGAVMEPAEAQDAP